MSAELKAKGSRIEELLALPTLTSDQEAEFNRLVEETEAIRSQDARRAKAKGLTDWFSQSAGGLALAEGGDWIKNNPSFSDLKNGTAVRGYRPSGSVTLEEREIELPGGLRIPGFYVNAEGTPLMDPAKIEATRKPEYKSAWRNYLRMGNGIKDSELRTLQEAADEAGGFLVPEDVLARIVSRLPTPTRVSGRVTRIPTSRDSMVVPKVVYTTDNLYTTPIRLTWTGEIPGSATSHQVTNPIFGQARIPVFTGMLSLPLTRDMVEDSAFPVADWVGSKFGETIDLAYDNMILNGLGGNQPTGLLTTAGASNGIAQLTTGTSGQVKYADLTATAFSVPEQYEENLTWVMNKVSGAQAIANLVDSQNRPLWGMGFQDAGLTMSFKDKPLLGYPVTLSGFMPNVASGNNAYAFGDLQGYYLVTRMGLTIQVLNEIQALSNQIVILGRVRFGGMVVEDWRLKALKIQ